MFTITNEERHVTIKAEGIELTYIKLYGSTDSKQLNTSYGEVLGTHVKASYGTHDYFIKNGRGRLSKAVQELIVLAEQHLTAEGYNIESFKPAYRR